MAAENVKLVTRLSQSLLVPVYLQVLKSTHSFTNNVSLDRQFEPQARLHVHNLDLFQRSWTSNLKLSLICSSGRKQLIRTAKEFVLSENM